MLRDPGSHLNLLFQLAFFDTTLAGEGVGCCFIIARRRQMSMFPTWPLSAPERGFS